MATRILLLATFLATASAANAAMLNWSPEVHPVPVIPHGLDWSIQLAPDPQPELARLPDEELSRIFPQILKLEYGDVEYDFTHFGSPSSNRSVGPIAAILTGSVFLLAAYDLIPRIHSRVLRYRSVDLRQNLFS